MAEYHPYPDEDTAPYRFTGTQWYLRVPDTGFDDVIEGGDIVYLPNQPHGMTDVLEPTSESESDEPAPVSDIPADLGALSYTDLQRLATPTVVKGNLPGDELREALGILRDEGEDAVPEEYR